MASRIGKAEWMGVYALAGTIDVVQWAADFFLGPGEAANAVIDPFIGGVFAMYFQLRGVSMIQDWKRLASLLGAIGLEEISVSVAPAWVFDVWYIHRNVRAEEATIRAAKEQEEAMRNRAIQPIYGLDENGTPVRRPRSGETVGRNGGLNALDGIRPPRGGLPSAA